MTETQSLAALDLNLLKVLDALLRTRSVSQTARELHRTPSAISRSLSRLRTAFGDALLVREGRSMSPTPVALSLQLPLARVLHDVQRLLHVGDFDPQAERTLRMCGADYVEQLLLPELATALSQQAPGLTLHFIKSQNPLHDLQAGRVDVAVNVRGSLDAPDLVASRLLDDALVCVLRQDHPALAEPWTLETYLSLTHALVAPGGSEGGLIDGLLAQQGHARKVRLLTDSFAAAFPIVSGSDLVVALPRRLAHQSSRHWPVVLRELPLNVAPFTLSAFWPARLRTDPTHRWFRGLLKTLAAAL